MATFKTIIIDRRLYIDDGRGLILIDTSSLASFHKEGCFCIDDITHNVPDSHQGICPRTLSNRLGVEVAGVLGMDILTHYDVWINAEEFGNFVSFETYKAAKQVKISSLPVLFVGIDGRRVRLMIDTAMPETYLRRPYPYFENRYNVTSDECVGHNFTIRLDFKTFNGPFVWDSRKYQEIHCVEPDAMINRLLDSANCDGIIGYDLISKYRVRIAYGEFDMPPQGI